MEVAASGTATAIVEYFHHTHPMKREISTNALLGSLLAVPSEGREKTSSWKHYNKLGTLPFINMGKGTGSYNREIENMQEARKQGIKSWHKGSTARLSAGYLSNTADNKPNGFNTEKDFVGWLIKNDITVCDLGAGTDAVRYKGGYVKRRSLGCKKLPAL